VAGGCGRAEAPGEYREVRRELVEDLAALGQALCATVAGGCGHAEALEELGDVLSELVEDLAKFGRSLCATGYWQGLPADGAPRLVTAAWVVARLRA
jgi:hypothetical protein